MNKLLVQTLNCTIVGHTDRIVNILFKLAVSIEKQNFINNCEYDNCYEEYIEEVATKNVQKQHRRL